MRKRSPQSAQQRGLCVESLESRTMLSTVSAARGIFDVRNIAVNPPTTTSIADVKNGPMSNSGQELVSLYRDYRNFRKSGGKDAGYTPAHADMISFKGSAVGVTIRGRNGIDTLTTKVRSLGGQIIYRSSKYGVVQAFVPIGQLHSLAVDPQVATVNPMYRSKTFQQGNANNQADEAQNADRIRTTYGLDGTGVKIGVISDSVDQVGTGIAGSIATGNLPTKGVQVIDDEPNATDEGRGMLELIHDIAPGADLAFATTNVSQLTFAQNIRALHAAGANVLVDDVGFFDEPYFQPGVIDQAITDVTKAGAVYFSAAGNSSDDGFEAPTNFTKIGRNTFVDFDPGPAADTRMRIQVTGGVMRFQWDNPYNGVVGNVTTDLDLYLYSRVYPKRIVASATANNIRTGVPIETMFIPSDGLFDLVIRVADQVEGSVLPTRFKFTGAGLLNTGGFSGTEYPGVRTNVFGHSGGADTVSVGAVPFDNAPPTAAATDPIDSEDFSSFGPVRHIFDANGDRLPNPLTLQKPDISGIDGTNTSFFGQDSFVDDDVLPNFSGTSAAAPNVAAVVALIRQAAPNATQAQILSALQSTARALNGAPLGTWDPQGGFGLIDGLAAVQQFVTAPTVRILPVSPNPTNAPVDSIKIAFNQQVSGFDVSDLTLRLDDGPNLLTGDNQPTTTDGGRTWMVRNLTDLTADPGQYTLELLTSATDIVNPTKRFPWNFSGLYQPLDLRRWCRYRTGQRRWGLGVCHIGQTTHQANHPANNYPNFLFNDSHHCVTAK